MIIIPESDAPFGSVDVEDLTVLERAKLACNTARVLSPNQEELPPTEKDKKLAREAFSVVTGMKPTANANIDAFAKYPNASLQHLDRMLSEYDQELVNSAVRIREFTKNRLLLEADNPDARIRIRALELLGKIKDVGLFTDRLEITHRTKSDEELVAELHNKLEKFMGTAEIVDDGESEEGHVLVEEQSERELHGLLDQLEM